MRILYGENFSAQSETVGPTAEERICESGPDDCVGKKTNIEGAIIDIGLEFF
jgi:hypothetical protein